MLLIFHLDWPVKKDAHKSGFPPSKPAFQAGRTGLVGVFFWRPIQVENYKQMQTASESCRIELFVVKVRGIVDSLTTANKIVDMQSQEGHQQCVGDRSSQSNRRGRPRCGPTSSSNRHSCPADEAPNQETHEGRCRLSCSIGRVHVHHRKAGRVAFMTSHGLRPILRSSRLRMSADGWM